MDTNVNTYSIISLSKNVKNRLCNRCISIAFVEVCVFKLQLTHLLNAHSTLKVTLDLETVIHMVPICSAIFLTA